MHRWITKGGDDKLIYNLKHGNIPFSILDGVKYNQDTNTLYIIDQDRTVSYDDIQMGYDFYDYNNKELFIGDIVEIASIHKLACVDVDNNSGIILRDMANMKNILNPEEVGPFFYHSNGKYFNTKTIINKSVNEPRYIYDGFYLSLKDIEYTGSKCEFYVNDLFKWRTFELEKLNQCIGNKIYAGSGGKEVRNGKIS